MGSVNNDSLGFFGVAAEEPQGSWDVATATYQKNFYIGSVASINAMNSCILSDDGLHMYVVHQDGIVGQWNLGTAWDVTTAVYFGSKDFSANDTATYGIALSIDGTKLIIHGHTNDRLYEYTLSTPFNITTATYVRNFSVSSIGTFQHGFTVDRSGRFLLLCEYNNDYVFRGALSTPWDLSTASLSGNLYVGSYMTVLGKATFSTDGDTLFVMDRNANRLYQWNLATPFVLSSASLVGFIEMATTCGTSVWQAHFDKTGKKMYVLGGSNKRVYQYALT